MCSDSIPFSRSILLGAASLSVVTVYPLMKRITYWPQAVLGTFRTDQRRLSLFSLFVSDNSRDIDTMTRPGVQLGSAPRLVCNRRYR